MASTTMSTPCKSRVPTTERNATRRKRGRIPQGTCYPSLSPEPKLSDGGGCPIPEEGPEEASATWGGSRIQPRNLPGSEVVSCQCGVFHASTGVIVGLQGARHDPLQGEAASPSPCLRREPPQRFSPDAGGDRAGPPGDDSRARENSRPLPELLPCLLFDQPAEQMGSGGGQGRRERCTVPRT